MREMEKGFLNNSTRASKMNDGSSVLRDLAKRFKNTDGISSGRDGKPKLPYRCVNIKESSNGLNDDIAIFV